MKVKEYLGINKVEVKEYLYLISIELGFIAGVLIGLGVLIGIK